MVLTKNPSLCKRRLSSNLLLGICGKKIQESGTTNQLSWSEHGAKNTKVMGLIPLRVGLCASCGSLPTQNALKYSFYPEGHLRTHREQEQQLPKGSRKEQRKHTAHQAKRLQEKKQQKK